MLKNLRRSSSIALLAGSLLACGADVPNKSENVSTPKVVESDVKYVATEESLSQHDAVPDWFRDDKLGIYFTWGPYTVAAKTNEWYPRWMHFAATEEDWGGKNPGYHIDLMDWHTETFGHPSEFGYHDMVDLFKAEHFDAEEWVDLFENSGAKFAGPISMHHDGFALWDSDVTPWNVANKGPKVDVMGEIFTELRKRGMKTVATFHHARHLQRYKGQSFQEAIEKYGLGDDLHHAYWNSHYPWDPDLPTSSDDPELALLYGNLPKEKWEDEFWMGTLTEVIDKYQPDLIWFDTWMDQLPIEKRYEFAAYYFNQAEEWGKEVMITHKHDDMPTSFSVLDLEKGKREFLTDAPWLSDDTISTGSWSYTDTLEIKPPIQVLHDFIDLVSKNGQLLLNLSPTSEGKIPEDQRKVLLNLGGWLKINGEAIYNTRPWRIYGEGPATFDKSALNVDNHFIGRIDYSFEDVRYTKNGDTVYAISLGTPLEGLVLPSLAEGSELRPEAVSNVEALNGDFVESWTRDAEGLKIQLKPDAPIQQAYAFRISK